MSEIIENLSSITGFILTVFGVITPLVSFFVLSKYKLGDLETRFTKIEKEMEKLFELKNLKEDHEELKQNFKNHETSQNNDMKEILSAIHNLDKNIVEVFGEIKKWKA